MHTTKERSFRLLIPLTLAVAPNFAAAGADGGFGGAIVESAIWYVVVPSVLLVCVAIPMLFKVRTFLALLFGLLAGGILIFFSLIFTAASPSVQIESSFYTFTHSIWITLGIVIVAFFFAAPEPDRIDVKTPKKVAGILSGKSKIQGICPTCDSVIPKDSFECPNCQASFGPGSPVKIKRLDKQRDAVKG